MNHIKIQIISEEFAYLCAFLEHCNINYKVDWYARTKIYVSMTFDDNSDSLEDSRFDRLSDYSYILMFSEHSDKFTINQISEALRSDRFIALIPDTGTEDQKKSVFLE